MGPSELIAHISSRTSLKWFAVMCLPAILALSTIPFASTPAAAQTPPHPDPERVAGHVVQGTSDAPLPEDLEVTLTIVDGEGNVVREMKQTAGSDGAYSFEDLPDRGSQVHFYRVSVTYADIRRTVRYEEAEDPDDVELTIYEPTEALEDVTVLTHSTVIDVVDEGQGRLGFLELVRFANAGDRTFVPDTPGESDEMPRILRFSLPAGYQGLSVENDLPSESVLQVESGLALFSPIPPGEFQLMMSYTVDYSGDGIDFVRNLPSGANQVRVLIPPGVGQLEGTGLSEDDEMRIGDKSYRVFSGLGYLKDSEISLNLSGLPHQSSFEKLADRFTSTQWTTVGIPVAGGAAMLLLLGYGLLFRRRRRPAALDVSTSDRSEVVSEIATLDERHAAGEIDDEEYEDRRERLVARALALQD